MITYAGYPFGLMFQQNFIKMKKWIFLLSTEIENDSNYVAGRSSNGGQYGFHTVRLFYYKDGEVRYVDRMSTTAEFAMTTDGRFCNRVHDIIVDNVDVDPQLTEEDQCCGDCEEDDVVFLEQVSEETTWEEMLSTPIRTYIPSKYDEYGPKDPEHGPTVREWLMSSEAEAILANDRIEKLPIVGEEHGR